MSPNDHVAFEALKRQLEAQFRKAQPQATQPVETWKGQQIVDFQEELSAKVQGRISEKWFYTYLKPERPPKLPRVDMLNLLSAYAGHTDWAAFLAAHAPQGSAASPAPNPVGSSSLAKTAKTNRLWWAILPMLALGGLVGWRLAPGNGTPSGTYTLCVEDAIRGTLIEQGPIVVTVLYENQSPLRVVHEEGGCLNLNLSGETITLVVSAPYYRPDTIRRQWQSHIPQERIALRSDDYARMIHYFSTGKVEDYEKRRQQLDMMFHDEARIFQEDPGTGTGVELYTKDEFIDKLTFPLASLQAITVLELAYENDLIVEMRFTQTPATP